MKKNKTLRILKERIFAFLDFEPNATHYFKLIKEFVKGNVTEAMLVKILKELISEGKISEFNYWFSKIKKIKIEFTDYPVALF